MNYHVTSRSFFSHRSSLSRLPTVIIAGSSRKKFETCDCAEWYETNLAVMRPNRAPDVVRRLVGCSTNRSFVLYAATECAKSALCRHQDQTTRRRSSARFASGRCTYTSINRLTYLARIIPMVGWSAMANRPICSRFNPVCWCTKCSSCFMVDLPCFKLCDS